MYVWCVLCAGIMPIYRAARPGRAWCMYIVRRHTRIIRGSGQVFRKKRYRSMNEERRQRQRRRRSRKKRTSQFEFKWEMKLKCGLRYSSALSLSLCDVFNTVAVR